MSTDWIKNNLEVYLPPIVIIVIGIVLGLIFKRYIHSRLKLVAKKSDWAGDDAVLDAIEPHIVVWFSLGPFLLLPQILNQPVFPTRL